MIELFDIRDVNRAASTFNPEKLLWLNQQYIKNSDPAHVARHLTYHLGRLGIDPAEGPDLVEVVRAQQERAKTLVEMANNSRFFYRDFETYDEKAARKHLKPEVVPVLKSLRERLAALEDWQAEPLHEIVVNVAEATGLKLGKVAQPLRVAVTGGPVSPPIDVTLALIGRDRTLARLDRAIAWIAEHRAETA